MADNSTKNEMALYRARATTWDISAVIFATIVAFIELFLLFIKPQTTIVLGSLFVMQGVMAFAMLTGAFFWAIVELLTPARRSILDLLVRFFGSFILGFFVGGFLAYYFHFGQYVLIPLSAGNLLALYLTLGIFFVFVVLIVDAAWAHNKTFVVRKARK